MAKKRSFAKAIVGISAAVVAGKVAYNKYRVVKEKFDEEENSSVSEEIKKYNSVVGSRVIEIEDEVFKGCEIKAVGSKMILDLSLAVFEKDVYINFSSNFSKVSIVLPEGVNVACDIDKNLSSIKNFVNNVTEDGIHTVYIIGRAVSSFIEVMSVDFYCDEEDFEDVDDTMEEDNNCEKVVSVNEKEDSAHSEDTEAAKE